MWLGSSHAVKIISKTMKFVSDSIISIFEIREGAMKDFNVRIGSRIKEKRIEMGLSRAALGKMALVSHKFLYDVEVGNKGISAETLYKIANTLNVSADWLLFKE
jgi:predicted transcriptional regulator